MKLWRPLMLPANALSETARFAWLALGAVATGAFILISVSTHTNTTRWLLHTTHGWAVMNALLWVFLANTVLLARDARALRLPTLERDALISLGLYGALGILLPALLLSWAGGHLLAVTIILLFGAGLGMAFALLPPYLATLAVFADGIPDAFSPWLPLPMQAGFSAWAGPLAVLLWLVLAWRIRGLLHGLHSLQPPHAPMVLVYRRFGWGWGRDAATSRWGQRTSGQGPAWARPTLDLRGCGPGHAEDSLRVALGGWWMPQTRLSRLWQCVLVLAGIVAGTLMLLLQSAVDRHGHAAYLATDLGNAGSVVFFGTLMSPLLAIGTIRSLYQRWGKTNAELPLLALLPGLGDAPSVKRALLRASLLSSLGVQLGLAMVLMILAGVMHLGLVCDAVLLLGSLGSSLMMCVFALEIFGANPSRGWGMALAICAGYVWIGASAALVESYASHVALSDAVSLMLAMGWSVFFVALLWLGRRGWHSLQQRPHPFLPNA